jgi:hypothetical protein
MSTPTSQNPDTLEGLESRLPVGIRRIPADLLQSTEREVGKLHRTLTDSGRASNLNLLRGHLTSQKSSGPQNLASLSTLQE